MNFRENEHLFLGVAILLLSFLSLAWNVHSFYKYNYTNLLFLYIVPNKILISNIVLALLAVILSVETLKGKLKVKLSLIIFISILLIYIVLNTFLIHRF